MARIRSLKPMFFQHDGLSALDAETHILAAGLLCYADDYGYFNANPKLIEAFVFPLRKLSGTIPEMLGSLSRIGYLRFGKGCDGRTYGLIINFDKHQRVHNPSASVIKELEIDWQIPEKLGSDSRENPLGIRNKEGNKEGIAPKAKKAIQFPEGYQPNQDHKELASTLGVNLRESFPAFRDYHTSKGNSFKDWDAALRTWIRNDHKFSKTSFPVNPPEPPNALEAMRSKYGMPQ